MIELGETVYLEAEVSTLISRLWNEKSGRPMIPDIETKEDLHRFISNHLYQREEYYKWDKKYYERSLLCSEINNEYPHLIAQSGGMISIDIAPRGNTKSQVADILNKKYGHIHFFGDKMDFGGNDYPLATTIELGHMGTNYPVSSWQETWEVLKQL